MTQGECGDPVSYYLVEWDSSDSFNSAALSSLIVDRQDLLLEQQVQLTAYCRFNIAAYINGASMTAEAVVVCVLLNRMARKITTSEQFVVEHEPQ